MFDKTFNCIFLILFVLNVNCKSPVVIHYPNSIFTTNNNWREMKPSFDNKLTKSDSYLKVGNSQDREDVWLFENWFYGMTNGTVLESGGLDGKTFSNSLFFEKYTSWFTIHIGIFSLFDLFLMISYLFLIYHSIK